MTEKLPTLTRRRIQAEVLGPVFAEICLEVGEEKASEILDRAIRKAAIAEGKSFAARANGKTSMADFIKLFELWTADEALAIEVHEASDTAFSFDVTRCRYAETYREMGLAAIGHLLSCNRDGTFCQGYDPRIKLDRAQTLMQGAPCCTFRYRWEADGGST